MFKKISLIVLTALGLTISSLSILPASMVSTTLMAQSEGITYQVVQDICHALQNEGYTTYDQAMQWYHTDEMTISQPETGTYAVVLPGSLIVVLEADEL